MEDGTTRPAYGFFHGGMFITNPYLSDCTRFEVDPTSYYGLNAIEVEELKKLNEELRAENSV